MIIFPTPFVARGPIYRGPVNYVAMAGDLVSVVNPVTADLRYRVSKDARRWHRRQIKGDITTYVKGGGAEPGAFAPLGMVRAFNTLFAYGRIWDDPDNSRAAVFKMTAIDTWDRITTSIDGTKGSSGDRFFAAATVEGSGNLVLLCNSGERVVSSNGTSFTAYADIGFTGTGNAIAAGTGVTVAAGSDGEGFSAANAAASFTARNLQFGTTAITHLRAGNVLAAFGGGKISTSALNSGTAWTAQTDPVGGGFDWAGYGNGQWFAAGVGKWIASALGATWAVPGNAPLSGDRVRSGWWDGAQWVLFLSGGVVAVSEDNLTWQRLTASGLAAGDYVATAKVAA